MLFCSKSRPTTSTKYPFAMALKSKYISGYNLVILPSLRLTLLKPTKFRSSLILTESKFLMDFSGPKPQAFTNIPTVGSNAPFVSM